MTFIKRESKGFITVSSDSLTKVFFSILSEFLTILSKPDKEFRDKTKRPDSYLLVLSFFLNSLTHYKKLSSKFFDSLKKKEVFPYPKTKQNKKEINRERSLTRYLKNFLVSYLKKHR